jgi:hypothetical protein
MTRSFVFAVLLSQAAFAGAPVITELQPRGAERGHAFTLTIMGRDLPSDARIFSTIPASFTLVKTDAVAMPGRSIEFLVEPKSDVAPGVYPIRIESPKGISNVLLFTVGTFPEVTEEESRLYARPHLNDSIETAEPIQAAPVTVNGTLRGPERDVFRVSGKAGERRVFEVEARRCGSAIDPVLRILDGSGKQLAISDDAPGAGLDARIDFTFPRDGNYYVEVHDARFSKQVQNFYRLKMGNYAYADGIFPLGGKRGEATEVTFFGSGLKTPVKTSVDLAKLAPEDRVTTISLPDSPVLPVTFAVSDLPELMGPVENGALPVPSVMNARLSKPGQIDRYKIAVEPGENLLFELQARELGTSLLEGIITVYDSSGKKLDSAGDKPLPEDVFAVQGSSRTSSDPFLNLKVPKDVHEISVTVEDLAERGGPLYGYRLITRKEAEDFRLSLGEPYVNIPAGGTAMLSVVADRRGYDGPIRLTIPDLPEGIQIDGGLIPREIVTGTNRSFNREGILTLTAAQNVELAARQLVVWGEGKLADGTIVRRRARTPGMLVRVAGAAEQGVVDRQRAVSASWLNFDLPAAISEPPAATLEVKETGRKQLEEGGRYEFEYTWNLKAGTPPKEVDVEIVGARDIRVTDMKQSEKGGTFIVNTTKATDPARYDLYINGMLKTDSGEEMIVSRPIAFEVTGGTNK